jgi:hypothetical protein
VCERWHRSAMLCLDYLTISFLEDAQTNFTSLATPSAVGSGSTALTTLMHEGGHAAHFANITQGSPFFSQVTARREMCVCERERERYASVVCCSTF